MERIFLSPPDVGPREREALARVLDSGWVAPAGAELDAFEAEIAAVAGREHAVALTSGTAALHLALLEAGVQAGAEVVVPTLTFVATANAVRYVDARPVFLDVEPTSWNLDPDLLEAFLAGRARDGQLPAAVVTVDLYGTCADYGRILATCDDHGIPVIEDAAEAVGASFGGRPAGAFGISGVFSFNGNKIVTTSGGGALVTDDAAGAAHARHLATQAREEAVHYEHREVGFNYRLSNVLAALGRAQLADLERRIERRGEIEHRYRAAFDAVPGIEVVPRPEGRRTNHWMTAVLVDPDAAGATRDDVIAALARADIEARPTWKPMHRQPLYVDNEAIVTGVADRVFDLGVCLPSGSGLTVAQQDRVVAEVMAAFGR